MTHRVPSGTPPPAAVLLDAEVIPEDLAHELGLVEVAPASLLVKACGDLPIQIDGPADHLAIPGHSRPASARSAAGRCVRCVLALHP